MSSGRWPIIKRSKAEQETACQVRFERYSPPRQILQGAFMPRVSLWFFAVAPIYVLIGMGFGIFMGATENFTLAPAHAHLNLIGWVTMALYGTFYALAREASKKLAWVVFWLNNAGAAIMFPSLSMVLVFGDSSPFLLP